MSGPLERAERAALRGISHMPPAHWREIIELIDEPIPPTPTGTIPAPDDEAARRLDGIDHIVVLMLENRSLTTCSATCRCQRTGEAPPAATSMA